VRARLLLLAVIAPFIAAYYLWAVRATGTPFLWKSDLMGYYDLLGRAFASGHLDLPIRPSPQLLAQPNPWDPSVDASLKLHDAVLYNGRYYIYYGAAPAILLFTPWRILTRHDLSQSFAGFLFAVAGFLFSVLALFHLLDLSGARPNLWILTLMILALALCQGIPYLLNRVEMYEIAISCGYCTIAAAMFFLIRSESARIASAWLAASGFCFGLGAASRPHLIFVGIIALAFLAFRHRRFRTLLWFCIPFGAVCLAIGGYNYARFGNPFEFGLKYHLGGPGQNQLHFTTANLIPGIYYMLLAKPDLSPVFPWIRMVFRFPFDSAIRHPLPADYFVEPSVGALWFAPFCIAALLAPFLRFRIRYVLATATAGSLAVLLFLSLNHFSTHRYIIDFLPLAILSALTVAAAGISAASGPKRYILSIGFSVLILYSITAGLALGIGGPYYDVLRNRPKTYLAIAGWFSPTPEVRPVANPSISLRFVVTFPNETAGGHEPILSIGHSHYFYSLRGERSRGTLRLVSMSEDATLHYEMPDPHSRRLNFTVTYSPTTQTLTVAIDGTTVLTHSIPMLVAAPKQVLIGDEFPGSIRILERTFMP
jgi:hypothetical protein